MKVLDRIRYNPRHSGREGFELTFIEPEQSRSLNKYEPLEINTG